MSVAQLSVKGDDPRNLIEHYKESHQVVARMIAAGMTDTMIRQRTGYSTRRLTLLKGSPLFQELVAVFRKRIDEVWDKNLDTYLDLGMSNMIRAEAQIAEALDEAEDEGGERISVTVLDKISQGRADRFGYSKHATLAVTHDFATAMDRAIARSGRSEALKEIEGTAVDMTPPRIAAPSPIPPAQAKPGTPTVPVAAPARSLSAVLGSGLKRRKLA